MKRKEKLHRMMMSLFFFTSNLTKVGTQSMLCRQREKPILPYHLARRIQYISDPVHTKIKEKKESKSKQSSCLTRIERTIKKQPFGEVQPQITEVDFSVVVLVVVAVSSSVHLSVSFHTDFVSTLQDTQLSSTILE